MEEHAVKISFVPHLSGRGVGNGFGRMVGKGTGCGLREQRSGLTHLPVTRSLLKPSAHVHFAGSQTKGQGLFSGSLQLSSHLPPH